MPSQSVRTHNSHSLLLPTGTEYHVDMSKICPQCLDANAFCHAMKSFTTERDFKTPDLSVMPGPVLSDEEQRQEDLREELEYLNNTGIGDFGDFDFGDF